MPTQTKENYLKALYYLHSRGPSISITDLGKEMEVSKPTVNNMVKKLEAEGWVKYEKYKPLSLTETGLKEATHIIRKHRLSEMFLNQIMGFGWEEVHDIAEEMEHFDSEMFFDRMDQILGFPKQDPHGSPIPDKNGNVIEQDYRVLSSKKPGDKVALRAIIRESRDLLQFLNKKKIKLGLEISIDSIEEFDKSMIISFNNSPAISLSNAVCNQLLVEELA